MNVSGAIYYPVSPRTLVRIRRGHSAREKVDYRTVVPLTTRTPPAVAVRSVTGSPGGQQTLTLAAGVAASYSKGDVIALGISPRTPDGLLVKVASLAQPSAGTVVAHVVPATIPEAIPRGLVDAHVVVPVRPRDRVQSSAGAGAVRLGDFSLGCGVNHTGAISASAGLDLGLDVHLEIGGIVPRITSASFLFSTTLKAGIGFISSGGGSCAISKSLFDVPADPIDIQVGPVPVVLVPHYGASVDVSGSYSRGIDSSAYLTLGGEVGVSYDSAGWHPVDHLIKTYHHTLADSAEAPASSFSLGASVAPTVGFRLYGLAGPHLKFSYGPQLTFSPPGRLDLASVGSLEAGVDLTVKVLGFGLALNADYTILKLTNPIAHISVASPSVPTVDGPQIVNASLPYGVVGRPYSTTLRTADNRNGVWTITTGALPAGLSLTPSGHLSGVPTSSGAHSFAVTFRDVALRAASRQFGLAILQANSGSIIQIATGDQHACALRASGTVLCWGSDYHNQLGDVLGAGRNPNSSVPVVVAGLTDATQISAGQNSTCAIYSAGSVRCWGPLSAPVAPEANVDNAIQVSTADQNACALLADQTIECWGDDTGGRLGGGPVAPSDGRTLVYGITDATEVSEGGEHGCALRAAGSVSCWGFNGSGQLGDGTTTSSATPVPVQGLTDATQISVGYFHTCAVRATGTIVCWGANGYGALGDGSTTWSTIPVTVKSINNAVQVSVSKSLTNLPHTCAVLADGKAVCWGADLNGDLGGGDGLTFPPAGIPYALVPEPVANLDDATEVSTGGGFTCALRSGGGVACFGTGWEGELGNGTFLSSNDGPVEVGGL